MEQSFFSKYVDVINKWRWLIVFVTLVFSAYCMTGFQKISFNGQYRIFFSEDNPKLQAFDDLQNTYTKDDSILFLVVPRDGDVFTSETLKIIKELTLAAWQIPYSTRVDSITNFQWTRAHIDEDGEEGILVTDLVENPESITAIQLEKIKNVALKEPTLVNRLISSTGHVSAINVAIELPGFGVGLQKTDKKAQFDPGKNIFEFNWGGLSLKPQSIQAKFPEGTRVISVKTDLTRKVSLWEIDCSEKYSGPIEIQFYGKEENAASAKAAQELERQFESKYPQIDVRLTGMTMMNDAFNSTIAQDLKTLSPLMYLTILVLTAILLRSFAATLITLLVIALSTTGAIGLFFLFGYELTGPSSSSSTMILTLAVADCIHILVLLIGFMRQGKDKLVALKEALQMNFSPVFLTSLTTCIGFLCMNFSDAPPYRDLGNITAAGVAIAFVLSVTFLPAMVCILPMKTKVSVESNESKIMAWMAEFVISRRPLIFSFFTLVTMGLAYAVTLNDLNDQFVNYFSEDVQFRQDTDFSMENLSGIYQIEFNLPAAGEQGISSPDYLKKLEEFKNFILSLKDVNHVNSVSDIFKKINRSMHNDQDDFYVIPDKKDLAAQYLLLYEFSLPQGFDLNNQINTARSATRFTITLDNVTTKRVKELTLTAENWLRQNAPEYMHVYAASPAIMFGHISESNIQSMLFGTLWAMLLISCCLAVALKSVSFGLISLIPNFMPAIMAFGVWGLINGQIGLGLSVVVCMTLGIVVDDTVHFLSKYLWARRKLKLNAEDAIRSTFKSVGKALVFTAIILTSGFFILTFSDISINSDMGKLTTYTIILALLADLLFLPAVLISFDRFLNREKK